MEKVICYTRGISKGDPGPAAIAIVLVDAKGIVLKEVSETIGNAGIEYAEYFAVIRGLQTIIEHCSHQTKAVSVQLRLSDQSVKKQLNSEAIVTNPGLISLFVTIHNLQVENFSEVVVAFVSDEESLVTNKTLSSLLDSK